MNLPRLAALVLAAAAAARAAAPAWVTQAAQVVVPESRGAAVVLDDQAVDYLTPEQTHRRVRYALRLLTEGARNVLVLHYGYPYNPDTSRIVRADAWVISADGRKTRAYHRGDYQDVSVGNHTYWNHQRVMFFDAADKLATGGMLACEIETEEPGGILEVQRSFARNLFTLSKSFEVAPPPGQKLVWYASSPTLPAPHPGSSPDSLRWTAGPKGPGPNLARPRNFLANPEVVFVRPEPPGQAETWAGLSGFAAGIMEPSIDLTAPVKAQAAALAGAQSSRWDRVRALSEFVQSQIVYLELTDDTDTVAGFRPHPSDQVLANRYGDCKDKAGLLVALLRSIGDDGRILLVNSGDPRAVSPDWPSIHFNHAIVAIPADSSAPPQWPRIDGGALGPLVVFDPTDSTTPLGVLTPSDQGGWALIVDRSHGTLVRLPQAEGPAHCLEVKAEASLGPDGELHAVIDKEWRGVAAAEAYAVRNASRNDRAVDRYSAGLHEYVPFVQNLTWKDEWKPTQADYRLHLAFQGANYGRPLGTNLLAISPQIDTSIAALPEWKTALEGVSWLWTGKIRWQMKLKLPAGYVVEELPDNWDRDGATVSSHLHYTAGAGEVIYESRFSIRPGFYSKPRYESIREFVVKLREAERRPILLRRTSPS